MSIYNISKIPTGLYLIVENLILRARSDTIDCAIRE